MKRSFFGGSSGVKEKHKKQLIILIFLLVPLVFLIQQTTKKGGQVRGNDRTQISFNYCACLCFIFLVRGSTKLFLAVCIRSKPSCKQLYVFGPKLCPASILQPEPSFGHFFLLNLIWPFFLLKNSRKTSSKNDQIEMSRKKCP